jgi:DNA-binding transcriptional regulator LsrR (DeoR family)
MTSRVEAAIAEKVLVLHTDGWSIRAIAKQFGISRMAVHRLIVAARTADTGEPIGEIAAKVARLRRLSARLERNRGVRLSRAEAAEVAVVLRREIAGMVGA